MNTELDSILSKVRGLTAKAEHPSTPPEEAEACANMADALMLKYSIKEITAEAAKPIEDRVKPKILTVNIGEESDITGYVALAMQEISRHCHCKIRMYTSYSKDGWNSKIYGFESDVQYFNVLYTTIRLHMVGVLNPKLDRSKSMEDNAWVLHNAGFNWLQIAEMYGWQKDRGSIYLREHGGTRPPADMKVPYWHEDEGWKPSTQVGSQIKRAYHRAAKERGESVTIIAANGVATYRQSAARGYVNTLVGRLRKVQEGRSADSGIILASRIGDLDNLFKEDNPDLFEKRPEPEPSTSKRKGRVPRYKAPKINWDAYERGVRHANSADLEANQRMGGHRTGEVHG